MHPPRFSEGKYIVHHPDYAFDITIEIKKHDTLFWKAISQSGNVFAECVYLGKKDCRSFWNVVYSYLSVDKI